MEKEFIPYEQALALKELGFDEPCFGYYDKKYLSELKGLKKYDRKYFDYQYFIDTLGFNDNINNFTLAPLYQQTFRWFREKYNLDCMIDRNTKDEYFGNKRYHKLSKEYETITKGYKTYEEAELECLKKLIEIVKNK